MNCVRPWNGFQPADAVVGDVPRSLNAEPAGSRDDRGSSIAEAVAPALRDRLGRRSSAVSSRASSAISALKLFNKQFTVNLNFVSSRLRVEPVPCCSVAAVPATPISELVDNSGREERVK